MEILTVILGVISVTLVFFVYNLLRKVEIYEDKVIEYQEIAVKQQEYVKKLSEIVYNSRELIKKIDENGIFEADDEVGEFFRFLKDIQETLNNFIINEANGKK
jgi:predicted transcriptional regulator YheO